MVKQINEIDTAKTIFLFDMSTKTFPFLKLSLYRHRKLGLKGPF